MSGTSPAVAYSSDPLVDSEKADVRRLCGYPPYGGIGQAGFQGWRYFQAYGLLEFRMNNLAPAEYQNVRLFLSYCYARELEIQTAGSTLNVQRAAAFTRSPDEMRERYALYTRTRRDLCAQVGVPPGPNLGDGGMRIIV